MIQLQEHEHIQSIVRRHWFPLAVRVLSMLVLLFFPFIMYTFISEDVANGNQLLETFGSFTLLVPFLGSLWIFIIWTHLFSEWSDYYLDGLIITNRRIILVEQRGFFNRHISSFRLERIQDMTVVIRGIIPTFLHFGTIHIRTAGEHLGSEYHEIVFRDSPQPEIVKQKILSIYEQFSKDRTDREGAT